MMCVPSFTAIAAAVVAVSIVQPGPLRELHSYVTPLAATVTGFALIPSTYVRRSIVATLGTLSVGAFGFHQFRRTHPPCALPPPGEQELALVTGASSGIGREISKELAKKGWGLVLVARREGLLNQLAEEIRASDPSRKGSLPIYVMPTDLSKPEEASRLYHRIVAEKQLMVTAVVNNAGLGYTNDFHSMPVEKVDELISLNLFSLTKLTRLFAADFAARGRGRLMSVSSIAGNAPGPVVAVYSATKAYVTSLTLALQHELEPKGVSVTCLIPGATFTEFSSTSKAHAAAAFTVPGLATSAEFVARAGVSGMLRGDSVVVPGLVNKLYLFAAAVLPPKLLRVVTSMAWSELPI